MNDELPQMCEENDLCEAKMRKILAIDTKTVSLINNGFTYDGETFSLSDSAQLNWTGIESTKELLNSQGMFPMNISTKSSTEYSLAYADVDAFFLTGVGTVKAHMDSGRTLKVQVDTATTVAEVEAVVDNR